MTFCSSNGSASFSTKSTDQCTLVHMFGIPRTEGPTTSETLPSTTSILTVQSVKASLFGVIHEGEVLAAFRRSGLEEQCACDTCDYAGGYAGHSENRSDFRIHFTEIP